MHKNVPNIDPSISESIIITEYECCNITLEVTRLKNTILYIHYIKVIFDKDTIPEYIFLTNLKVKVEPCLTPC